mgnify:CR=1 FL=1
MTPQQVVKKYFEICWSNIVGVWHDMSAGLCGAWFMPIHNSTQLRSITILNGIFYET